ncbi:MAG: TIGR00289 family protein [Candidatus Micrarchaeaceae archaeon]
MINAALFSGGKDSTLAIHKAFSLGIKVDLLITIVPRNPESYMFHFPNLEFTKLQAEAMGIRQFFAGTSGNKEEELEDLEAAIRKSGAGRIITGAIASEYQASRVNAIARKLGIEHVAPLWHMDQIDELEEVAKNFEAIITAVSAEGLTESFLGKKIDAEMVAKIKALSGKFGINAAFEGGEAETFVLDAPLFKKRITIKNAEIKWHANSGVYIIKEAELSDKDK